MMNELKGISTDARVESCQIEEGVKIYGNAEVKSSNLGLGSVIGDQAIVMNSTVGEYASINRRNYICRSHVGRFSYTGIGTTVFSANIGNFCSISWNVSVGGGNHDYGHVTTSPLWRFRKMVDGQVDHSKNSELQKRFEAQLGCVIGHDVWIATNAVILRGVEIGNGAVIGAGAIVNKNVEPYSIVAGVPARTKKKRFDEKTIEALQCIRWWDWPTEVIQENADLIYSSKIDDSVVQRLREVAKEYRVCLK